MKTIVRKHIPHIFKYMVVQQLGGGGVMLLDFFSICCSFLYYNLGQNICRLFHFLAQFFFTTSETELDYYHQKVSARVTSRVAERLKT